MWTRARKEFRSLAWPAVLILFATLLAAAWSWQEAGPGSLLSMQLASAAFYIGVPLLAASVFGTEFQQRTVVLLLSQPVSRTRLWLEKSTILAVMAGVLVAVQAMLLRGGPFQPGRAPGVELLFVVAIVCSTAFWTLVARSLIGGLAFSLAAVFLIELAGRFLTETFGSPISGNAFFLDNSAMTAARVLYSAAALWLGWRLFLRLEVASGDTDIASWDAAASATWSPLRARPTGALFNLVRKELQLQRATMLIAGLFAACWLTALAVMALRQSGTRPAEIVFTILLAMYLPLAVVLAGAIPAGEEETIGLRAWHLTLPISVRVQWLVKLAVSLVVAGVLVVSLPLGLVAVTTAAVPIPQGGAFPLLRPVALEFMAVAVLVSFWAATLLGHTVRAAVATALAGIGLAAAWGLASWAGHAAAIAPRVETALMVRWQLTPDDLFVADPRVLSKWGVISAGIVIALVTLGQSLAAFGRARTDRGTLARYAAGLGAAVFLVGFCFSTASGNLFALYRYAPMRELTGALQAVASAAPRAERLQPTVAELEQTGRLSEPARRWLRGVEISVQAVTPMNSPQPYHPRAFYRASLRFPNDRSFKFMFSIPR